MNGTSRAVVQIVPELVLVEMTASGGVEHALAEETRIGRDASNDIVLSRPTVSRRHAVVKATPGGDVTIVDVGSSSGTFVNGARVSEAPLSAGAEIVFGAHKMRLE